MSKALDRDEVARRAYELFLSRGGEHGHDVDDWLRAEREVTGSGSRPGVDTPVANAGDREAAHAATDRDPSGSAAKRAAPRAAPRARAAGKK